MSFERACLPTLGERTDVLLGERVLRQRSDGPRDPDALLDDLAIPELREALGDSQDAIDRSFAPRAKQRRHVALARLRARRLTEAAGDADLAIGVAHRDHALPVAALQGGGVRLAPRHLRGADVAPSQRRVDPLEVRPPRELRIGPQGVVGEQVHGHDDDDHQRGQRGHGQD